MDSGEKLDMLRSLGADHVIDYMQEDFTQNGQTYDVIFDVIGKASLSRSRRSIKPNGVYLLANPGPSQLIAGLWTRMTSNRKVFMQPAGGTTEDLVFLRELIETGKLGTVIDRRYPLAQIAEAHRYVGTGQKQGNVVITVGHTGD